MSESIGVGFDEGQGCVGNQKKTNNGERKAADRLFHHMYFLLIEVVHSFGVYKSSKQCIHFIHIHCCRMKLKAKKKSYPSCYYALVLCFINGSERILQIQFRLNAEI